MLRAPALLALCLCASVQAQSNQPSKAQNGCMPFGTVWTRTTLYFGLARPTIEAEALAMVRLPALVQP